MKRINVPLIILTLFYLPAFIIRSLVVRLMGNTCYGIRILDDLFNPCPAPPSSVSPPAKPNTCCPPTIDDAPRCTPTPPKCGEHRRSRTVAIPLKVKSELKCAESELLSQLEHSTDALLSKLEHDRADHTKPCATTSTMLLNCDITGGTRKHQPRSSMDCDDNDDPRQHRCRTSSSAQQHRHHLRRSHRSRSRHRVHKSVPPVVVIDTETDVDDAQVPCVEPAPVHADESRASPTHRVRSFSRTRAGVLKVDDSETVIKDLVSDDVC